MQHFQFDKLNQRFVRLRGSYSFASFSIVLLIWFAALTDSVKGQIDWNNTTGSPNPFYDSATNWAGGLAPTSTQTARFNHAATYEVWWDEFTVTNTPSAGFLKVQNGQVVFLNQDNTAQHEFRVNGSGGVGSYGDFSVSGASTTLTNRGLHLHSRGGATISEATFTLDGSHSQGAKLTIDGAIGLSVEGTLNVFAGGVVDNSIAYIGRSSGAIGIATVNGSGSQWNNSSNQVVGFQGNGSLNVEAGGLVSSFGGVIGSASGSTGAATVTGMGSYWNNTTGVLYAGASGNGTLNVSAGGKVSSWNGFIGSGSTSTGIATVTGVGSQWNNSTELRIGERGSGTLNVAAGGVVSNTDSLVGWGAGSTGMTTVNGVGSLWNNSGSLYLGYSGNGTMNIAAGGLVSSKGGSIGYSLGSTGTATITGAGSQWNITTGILDVGRYGAGTLNITNGGEVSNSNGFVTTGFIGRFSGSTGTTTVTGAGSKLNSSGYMIVGGEGNGTLNVEAGGSVLSDSGAWIGGVSGGTGAAKVAGTGSQWNTAELHVADSGNGTLSVEAGGVVGSIDGFIGTASGSTGTATITGTGSQWNNAVRMIVGGSGNGTLKVEAGGVVSSGLGSEIGNLSGATGMVTVNGTGSLWNNSGDLTVGDEGNGSLNVEAAGVVNNTDGFIGRSSGSHGTATVKGTSSQWNSSGDLAIAPAGTGTLNILDNGLVAVGGTTTIGSNATVNLAGGRFEFGQTTLAEFAMINTTSGSIAGNIDHTGITNVATLTPFQYNNVDMTEVTFSNTGSLYGNARLGIGLINKSSGDIEMITGERMRWAGVGNTNFGEVNNFGGQIRFENDFTNQSGALVGGRGQFIADGGWTNNGVMAFSGGFADVHGDLNNSSSGMIAIGGNMVTTFYDDVTMNAANLNMEIAENSTAVFFGSYNGGSTGLGTVQAFGDLRPGNSPAIVSFGGDLEMGVNTATFIELGGWDSGAFDQMYVAGDLNLNGVLDVSLIDGFQLSSNMDFLIADVMGDRLGMFDGLSEGGLVGTYNGYDLFITYASGDGNDVGLFTAVPEPASCGILGLLLMGGLFIRRRRSFTSSR